MNEKLVEARNNTHNAHIARMILDSLDKLYQNCDGAAPRRWIWELMQNAKDVVNSTEKLKIYVAFNEGKGYVTLGELRMFYHFMVHIYRSGDCEFRGCCNLSE